MLSSGQHGALQSTPSTQTVACAVQGAYVEPHINPCGREQQSIDTSPLLKQDFCFPQDDCKMTGLFSQTYSLQLGQSLLQTPQSLQTDVVFAARSISWAGSTLALPDAATPQKHITTLSCSLLEITAPSNLPTQCSHKPVRLAGQPVTRVSQRGSFWLK